jgi:hypothetical protein
MTLEMTERGMQLEKMTEGLDWESQAKPLWDLASREFAEGGGNGIVHVFQAGLLRTGSAWATQEYPALVRQGATIIYHLVEN